MTLSLLLRNATVLVSEVSSTGRAAKRTDYVDVTWQSCWGRTGLGEFENLQPEKALWEKHAHLFNRIDTERERFLEFGRWWGGFYFLSREEILSIVRNLFIGNELEHGRLGSQESVPAGA